MEVLRAARLPFIELLADLGEAEWHTPSPCDGWRVQEVAVTRGTGSYGAGPEVRASPETLLLLLAGRRVGDDGLSGPGAARVRTGPR